MTKLSKLASIDQVITESLC